MVVLPVVGPILAIWFAARARREIAASPGTVGDADMPTPEASSGSSASRSSASLRWRCSRSYGSFEEALSSIES